METVVELNSQAPEGYTRAAGIGTVVYRALSTTAQVQG